MTEDPEDRRLAERTGIRAPELLARLRARGFDAESVELLFLVPLVGMAGADGDVSYAERTLVKELAARGGIERGTPAWAVLDGWLLEPPAGETLDDLLALLSHLLAALPRSEADAVRARLRVALERVGRASGGAWRIGALSRTERRFAARVMARV